MKRTLLTLFIIVNIGSSLICAQPVVTDLEKYLAQIKADINTPFPSNILSDFNNEHALLKTLYRHREDPGEQFQFRVLDLIRLISQKSRETDVRKSGVSHLVRSIADPNLRISGFASQAVMRFRKLDFSQADKDSLIHYLKPGMPNLDALFRLTGYLEIQGAKEKISSILILPMSATLKWNARLALSRLGDQQATDYILDKLNTTPIDDAFVYSLMPGLIYTRDKKIFQHLERIIQSDEYRCQSAHPDSKTTVLCAFRVLESIAPAIGKFPVKTDESGDLLVDNYAKALETCRAWFKQNPAYKITRESM